MAYIWKIQGPNQKNSYTVLKKGKYGHLYGVLTLPAAFIKILPSTNAISPQNKSYNKQARLSSKGTQLKFVYSPLVQTLLFTIPFRYRPKEYHISWPIRCTFFLKNVTLTRPAPYVPRVLFPNL
jgi:hypothetical protein